MRINEINMVGSAATWEAAGFTVVDGCVPIGKSVRIKLSEGEGSAFVSYTLGCDDLSKPGEYNINGLTTRIEATSEFVETPGVMHANSVVGLLKLVLKGNSAEDTRDQILALAPELGPAEYSGTSPEGILYFYWTQLSDAHFEIVSDTNEYEHDFIVAIMFEVDDLDAAIASVGADKVSAKGRYMERDTVALKPGLLGENISFITMAKS